MRVLPAAILIVCLGGCAPGMAGSGNPPVQGNTSQDTVAHRASSPATTLRLFYSLINAHRFREAYADLAPDGRPAYARWKAGYMLTQSVHVEAVHAGSFRIQHAGSPYTCVGIEIAALNHNAARAIRYGGTYLMVYTGGRWRIVLAGSRLSEGGSSTAPSRAACLALIRTRSTGLPPQTYWLSFVNPSLGYALGIPCNFDGGQSERCIHVAVAKTMDGGTTWRGVNAPPAHVGFTSDFTIEAGNMVGEIRFADARNGWAFDPALYATHDGSAAWTRVSLSGMVSDVIPVGQSVWAINSRCRGSLCSAAIIASSAGSNDWHALPQPSLHGVSPPFTLDRVDASHAWFLYKQGRLASGVSHLIMTSDGGVHWRALPDPCTREFNDDIRLAAHNDQDLYLICAGQPGTGQQLKQVFRTTSGGTRWQRVGGLGAGGYISDLAVTGPSTAFATETRGNFLKTVNAGSTWSPALPLSVVNPSDGSLGPLDFINPIDGWVASFPHRLFRTTDGGRTWQEIQR